MRGLLTVLLLAFVAVAAYAQTGQITGIVTDASGASVPGAQIAVTNTDTAVVRNTVSNATGNYTVPFLQPAVYNISVQAAGFKTLTRESVRLQVDDTLRLDFEMQVGNVAEAIEISATAELLQTASGSLGTVIESKQFTDLPLNNRTALGLLTLSEGVVASRGFSSSFNAANQFSANGSRPGQNEILLDGAPNTLPGVWPGRGILGTPMPVDSVQEFKVQTSSFSAEFGRTGGGLVNMVTKSGSNEWHGSAFEFLRNSKFDANDFFSNRNGIPLGSFKRNQFGGTLGGPVILPKLYNGRDKTFFFFNYQGTRASTAANLLTTVPTEAMRRGNFSDLRTRTGELVVLYDPLTTETIGGNPIRQAFPNNIIPVDRINAIGTNIAAYYPLPNLPGSIQNYAASDANRASEDVYGVRIDQVVSSRQQFFARYNYTRDDSREPRWFGGTWADGRIGLDQDVQSIAGDYVLTIGPSSILSLRYGFTDRTHDNLDPATGTDLTTLGFPSYINEAAQRRVFSGISVAGYQGMGNNEGANAFSYRVHSTQASLTKVANAHSLRFGADIRFHSVVQERGVAASGAYNFSRNFTSGPNANRPAANSGDAFAALMLGIPADGDFGSVIVPSSMNEYLGFYLQDDWRVNSRLTLNIGLRYELELPRKEAEDRLDWFDFNAVNPLSGRVPGFGELKGAIQFAGVNGNPRRHFNTDRNNFGPRIAFAYQLTPATVVRGGYGLFYGSGSVGAGGWNIASQGYAPNTDYVGSLDGLRPTRTLSDPFPEGFAEAVGNAEGALSLVGQNVARIYDRATPLPYNQHWTFSIQRQIASVLVQASYAGNKGVNLGDGAGTEINQLPPEALALGTRLQQLVPNPFFGLIETPGVLSAATVRYGQLLRPYPHFGNLTIFNPAVGQSIYHGLSLKAERRFGAGIGFLASYTFSKNISDAPATIGTAVGHQNTYNRAADRSVVEDDIPHRLVGSTTWELPFGRGKQFGNNWNRLGDAILGGWQLNGIVTLQSGLPLAFNTNPATLNALGGRQRPNATGIDANTSGRVQDRLNNYLNPAAFTIPEPFTYGDVGRVLGDVRSPSFSNVDFSLFKVFSLTDSARLQVRGEAFNLLNRPVFGLPNTAVGSLAYGTITSQRNDPRQVQLGLRIFF
jgi:hypothetical protein